MSDAKIRKAVLAVIARERPAGYEDEVRRAAVREDDTFLWLPRPAYESLKAKYRQPQLVRHDTVSFLQKAKNFAVATAKHVAAGMPMCSDEEIIRRHDICVACEFYKNSSCTKCGCPISRDRKFVSKLAWADQSCPVGKWGNGK